MYKGILDGNGDKWNTAVDELGHNRLGGALPAYHW